MPTGQAQGKKPVRLEDRSFALRKSKRATIYFEPDVHAHLRLEAARRDSSISEIVNELAARALGMRSGGSEGYPTPEPIANGVREPLRAALETGPVQTAANALTRESILSTLHRHRSVLRALGIERIGLFGSLQTGQATAASDLDLLAVFRPGEKTFDRFMTLAAWLEELFGRRVELVTPQSLTPPLGPAILEEAEYADLG